MTLELDKLKDLPKDQTIITELMQALYAKKPITGPDGVLTKLLKQTFEVALEGEIDAHFLANKGQEEGNRRNGKSRKTVQSAHGSFELETPRDRNASFERQLVKKRQTVITEEVDNKILSLYALGSSYEAIAQHIEDMYGCSISDAAIHAVSERLLPQISEWRSRPLERVYAIVFLDGMYFKVREEGMVKTKVMYNVMGIDKEGKKDVLGFYLCESEGASFWLGVLNDLKARGVEDMLIACIDGLKGFPEAIQTAFPQTQVQLCIVHQIRNSLKMIASKDKKAFMVDLKKVYKASNEAIARQRLNELAEKYSKYQAAIKPWLVNWEQLSAYFKYAEEIRRLVYTTNPIEGFHRQIRKYTKTKGAFTHENALLKLVFCAIRNITRKWTMPLANWAVIFSELDIHFPNRLEIA